MYNHLYGHQQHPLLQQHDQVAHVQPPIQTLSPQPRRHRHDLTVDYSDSYPIANHGEMMPPYGAQPNGANDRFDGFHLQQQQQLQLQQPPPPPPPHYQHGYPPHARSISFGDEPIGYERQFDPRFENGNCVPQQTESNGHFHHQHHQHQEFAPPHFSQAQPRHHHHRYGSDNCYDNVQYNGGHLGQQPQQQQAQHGAPSWHPHTVVPTSPQSHFASNSTLYGLFSQAQQQQQQHPFDDCPTGGAFYHHNGHMMHAHQNNNPEPITPPRRQMMAPHQQQQSFTYSPVIEQSHHHQEQRQVMFTPPRSPRFQRPHHAGMSPIGSPVHDSYAPTSYVPDFVRCSQSISITGANSLAIPRGGNGGWSHLHDQDSIQGSYSSSSTCSDASPPRPFSSLFSFPDVIQNGNNNNNKNNSNSNSGADAITVAISPPRCRRSLFNNQDQTIIEDTEVLEVPQERQRHTARRSLQSSPRANNRRQASLGSDWFESFVQQPIDTSLVPSTTTTSVTAAASSTSSVTSALSAPISASAPVFHPQNPQPPPIRQRPTRSNSGASSHQQGAGTTTNKGIGSAHSRSYSNGSNVSAAAAAATATATHKRPPLHHSNSQNGLNNNSNNNNNNNHFNGSHGGGHHGGQQYHQYHHASSNGSGNNNAEKSESNECKNLRKQMKSREKDGYEAIKKYALDHLRNVQPMHHWRIWMDLADLAKRENNVDEARKCFEKVHRLEPNAAQGWLEHAKLEEENAELERCEDLLERGLSYVGCRNNESLIIKYIKLMEQNDKLSAVRAMLSRIKNVPIDRSWKVILEGAMIESRDGNIPVARKLLKFLMANVPKHGPIFYEAYRLEEKCEDFDRALLVVESGLEENPRYGPLWFAAFHTYEKLSHRRGGSKSSSTSSSPSAVVNLASLRKCVERSLDPANISKELHWKVHYEHALIEERAGYTDEAREALVKSVKEAMPNLRWKVWLAGVRLELSAGRIDVARDLLKRALEEVPVKSRAAVLIECSRLEEYVVNIDRARGYLQQAKREAEHEWKVFLECILLEMRAGDIPRAIKEAEAALAIHKGTGRLWAVLIQLKHIEGEEEQYRVFMQAFNEVPKSGEVWCEGARISLNPLSSKFSLDFASIYLHFAMKFTPQYGDSLIEYLRLHLLKHGPLPEDQESKYLEQLCVNADPNYGPLWAHCKCNPLDTNIQVLKRAKDLLTREILQYRHIYQHAIMRSQLCPIPSVGGTPRSDDTTTVSSDSVSAASSSPALSSGSSTSSTVLSDVPAAQQQQQQQQQQQKQLKYNHVKYDSMSSIHSSHGMSSTSSTSASSEETEEDDDVRSDISNVSCSAIFEVAEDDVEEQCVRGGEEEEHSDSDSSSSSTPSSSPSSPAKEITTKKTTTTATTVPAHSIKFAAGSACQEPDVEMLELETGIKKSQFAFGLRNYMRALKQLQFPPTLALTQDNQVPANSVTRMRYIFGDLCA